MIRRHKWLLGFTIIYWLLVVMAIVLFAVSFQKVPLQTYGLKTYYFSPSINPTYYIPGLYDIGVGYYFNTLPSSKQYLMDNTLTVINSNLEKINVKYSLCYRINPNNMYTLYETIGTGYESYLIASVNNIISSVFLTVSQSQSRVTLQQNVANVINSANGTLATSLSSSITVQALWINQLQFSSQIEQNYQNSLSLSNSYQQAYETTQLEYQKARMQSRSIQQTIALYKEQMRFDTRQNYNSQFMTVLSTDLANEQTRETRLSYNYLMKRIWTYYNSTKMLFRSPSHP